MTIDIEKLIEEIDEDGSGKIEFGEFNTLLNGNWICLYLLTYEKTFVTLENSFYFFNFHAVKFKLCKKLIQ